MAPEALVQEFLYADPDTGMIICMIADGDGFRPATAFEEMQSSQLQSIYEAALNGQAVPDPFYGVSDEDASINSFVGQHERAFGTPSMS